MIMSMPLCMQASYIRAFQTCKPTTKTGKIRHINVHDAHQTCPQASKMLCLALQRTPFYILAHVAGSTPRGPQARMAADADTQSFDLKGILEESLKAPLKSAKAAAPGPSPPPVPAPIPEAPPRPPQVPFLLHLGYVTLQAGGRGARLALQAPTHLSRHSA